MVNLKGKRVLITGAGGFIGGALASALVNQGALVWAGYKDTPLSSCLDRNLTAIQLDVTDLDRVRDVISAHEIEYVYHLAANAIVRVSAKDPLSTYQSNVMGTVTVLEACRAVGKQVKKIIVASSDKAYGDHEELPYREDFALIPKNSYDTSKACCDMIARSYAHNYDMPVIVTRCSNVYGPGDLNMSRIIPNTICRVLSDKQPELYSDIQNMEREFIFIDDVVEAYIDLTVSSEDGQAYNIGGTGPISISLLVEVICDLAGKPRTFLVKERTDKFFREIQKQCIDADKIYRQNSWFPKTSLIDGLKKTIEFYRDKNIGRR